LKRHACVLGQGRKVITFQVTGYSPSSFRSFYLISYIHDNSYYAAVELNFS
jgi:hypothetical protein